MFCFGEGVGGGTTKPECFWSRGSRGEANGLELLAPDLGRGAVALEPGQLGVTPYRLCVLCDVPVPPLPRLSAEAGLVPLPGAVATGQ